MFNPHSSERQRERQRGLVKQTFELDEAAAAERQEEQVASGAATTRFGLLFFFFFNARH